MDRAHETYNSEEGAERLLKEAFGADEDQLLGDFLRAQTEIKDPEILQSPDDGFEKLVNAIEERHLTAAGRQTAREEEKESEKPLSSFRGARRRRLAWKAGIVAAAVALMMLGMAITAGAKKDYQYSVRQRDSLKNDMLLSNVDTLPEEDRLEEAYQEISGQACIPVLRLGYVPERLTYLKTEIVKNPVIRATMYFRYGDRRFHVVQQTREAETSVNVISDRMDYESVYNELLKKEIVIRRVKTEAGEEYSACIVDGDSYYQLSGGMEEEIFRQITENVYLEN